MKLPSWPTTTNRRWLQLCVLATTFGLISTLVYFYSPFPSSESFRETSRGNYGQSFDAINDTPPHHPIDDLIEHANDDFTSLLSKETKNVASAAAAYRNRRGRHPPPHFDQWFSYARKHNALIIEDLFDQIYHDLEPFWALAAQSIREAAASWEFVLSIRNGALTVRKDDRYRMTMWHDMLRQIGKYLPDVDIAFNTMDEPRVLVPWETINEHITTAHSRKTVSLNDTLPDVSSFGSLGPYNRPNYDHPWTTDAHYWSLSREACPPSTAARTAEPVWDYSTPPSFPSTWPNGSYEGYVSNWTVAKDPCSHPHLRELHGTFIEPISLSTTTKLFPVFGGSKLPMNNDILLPAPRYWTNEVKFDGGGDRRGDWNKRHDKVIWRGVASGGRNKQENWRRFHRHRFLSMLNGTQVRAAQQETRLDFHLGPEAAPPAKVPQNPQNFPLPDHRRPYNVTAIAHSSLPEWINSFADAAFINLECFPGTGAPTCPYTDAFYAVATSMPMRQQYAYKYLPDIDGNSFSGRYRAFLLSHSLPIKATIYSEWHDSRLIAWKHFVPMDNTFVDFYGIMDYFLGFDAGDGRRGGHDGAAKRIAEEGRVWAARVLRKEDMLVYIYRLVLEYARVADDRRERMGFVDDLKK